MCYDSDYFLGYLAADGCIHANSNRVTLSSNLDPDILQNYADFLGPVKVRSYLNKKYGVLEYSVSVRDKEVSEYLQSLGLTPQKSLTMSYNGSWSMEFIRGVFDGDGSIFKTKEGLLRFSICTASKKFAIQIRDFLKVYKPKLSSHNGMYSVRINKQEEIKKLYAKLYQNGSYFLERKKRKFGLPMLEIHGCNTANSGKQ